MTKVLGSKLPELWAKINNTLVPRQATVTAGNDSYIVTLQNLNSTPDTLVSFNIPTSSGGGDSTPIGTLLDFAGTNIPAGYLLCDGRAISRTEYSALFTAIGTTWGTGDGSTTFNLPNLCGRTTIGVGTITDSSSNTATYSIATVSGEIKHKLASNESGIAAHTHTISQQPDFKLAHSHKLPNSAVVYNASGTQRLATSGSGTLVSLNNASGAGLSTGGASTEDCTITANTYVGAVTNGAQSASAAHNNMQPYATVNKIIKAVNTDNSTETGIQYLNQLVLTSNNDNGYTKVFTNSDNALIFDIYDNTGAPKSRVYHSAGLTGANSIGHEFWNADGETRTNEQHVLYKDELLRERKTASSGSISAGGTKWVDIDCTKSGYTLLGVVGYYINGTTMFMPYCIDYKDANTAQMAIKNTGSGALSATIELDVLYKKTS